MMNNRRDSDGQPLEKRTEYYFPDELWEQVISKLTLKNNIRASAVSKRFLAIATLVQKTNKPPLLMIAPKSGDSYSLFDPFNHKSYWLDLPELRGAGFHHSKDGWLLMANNHSKSVFLFRPYTRELIQLPSLSLHYKSFAFSSAPTSPNCMVFAVHRVFRGTIQIDTCRPGDIEWTNVNYQPMIPLDPFIWNRLIFCKGLLYIFESHGLTVIYNPKESSWTVQDLQIPRDLIRDCNGWWTNENIVEPTGDIIKVVTFTHKSQVILMLDLPNRTWVKMETLGGNSLFISYLSSHVMTDLIGNERNNVYFPNVDFDENRCISYSFDEGKFLNKNQRYSGTIHGLFGSVWIDAPEDLSAIE